MHRLSIAFVALFIFIASFIGIVRIAELRFGPRSIEKREGTTGAMAALDFWTRSRAYPAADIPPDKYYAAYRAELAKRPRVSGTLGAGNIWGPVGPLNLQGRSISVALNPLNPSTVYLGSASGGLWRSYTGGLGADWQQVALGQPALGISSIVIDPSDSNTIYLGTGEVYRYQGSIGGLVIRTTRGSYGIGILKTTDGGATWTKSLDWSYDQERGIQKIAMNPHNPSSLYAATTEGIYKSTDAGGTWNIVWPLQLGEDIVINPSDTNQVLVTIGDLGSGGTGVYRTTDGGTSWNQMTTGLRAFTGKALLEGYAPHPNVVYMSLADSVTDTGGLYRSTDFGLTWTLLYTPSNLYQVQGWYSHFVAVNQTDSSQIVYAGVPVYKSTNGGATFFGSSGIYSDNHSYAHHPTNPNILYVVDDDGIYRSTDFGTSFTSVGYGLQTGQFYNGFASSATDSLLGIVQSQDHIPGYIYQGSMNWGRSAVDEVGWTAIDQTSDAIMYADSRNGGALYKSTDRGGTFSFSGGFGGSGAWNSPFILSSANHNVLYYATSVIYKSTSAGSTWVSQGSIPDGNSALSMAMTATSPDTAFVGTAPTVANAHVYRTTNGGTNWTDVTGTLPNRYPMDIAVDPESSRTVYVVFGGFGSGHVFKSTNTGSTWTDMTGTLPDIPTTAVLVDPLHSNVVYVGNDFGVYVSTDAGGTWSSFSQGLPDAVIVADLSISPSNRVIRAVTHGNGMYERKMLFELPANYFDYRALSLISPSDGAMDQIGVSISPIQASFRSLSAQAQTDSFNVKFRILHGAAEIYTSMRRIAGLASGEVRQVTFDSSFTPSDTGVYTLQAINLAVDQDPSNDTLNGALTIVTRPDVSYFTVNKVFCTYTEITGGSPGPAGDDVQLRVGLPFSFRYDGYMYDSVQISTNGWVEFGTGARGSLEGLSTDAQIGGYFTPTLGTNGRPTKALGPWWADLNTYTGAITYSTVGSLPNRTFVVQWKNVLSNYDPSLTGVYINFQVRLNETDNTIDYSYGPVNVSGSSGTPAGASIGLKDYVGGDFRFYDIAAGGPEPSSALISSLTPVANWPGPDTCYHLSTNPAGIAVFLGGRWNLVSDPVTRADRSVRGMFPASATTTALAYVGSYQPVDSLQPGFGYWVKVLSPATQFISGSPLPSVTVQLDSGWNLIGSVDHEIPAPSGGIIKSEVFSYGAGYAIASTIAPGKGYWVKTDSAGSIVLGPRNAPKSAVDIPDLTLTITDGLGRSQSLYVRKDDGRKVDLARYDMPPLPPAEDFDARFSTQRIMETFTSDLGNGREFPVRLQSPVYPLTIAFSVTASGGQQFFIEEGNTSGRPLDHRLAGQGSLSIASGNERSIAVKVAPGVDRPTAFALRQNYPNPFNPTTAISFDLPSKNHVTLKVYDILGRTVMTLADGDFDAGSYTIHADFSAQASGVYLYRLTAGSFQDVRKMVVTK